MLFPDPDNALSPSSFVVLDYNSFVVLDYNRPSLSCRLEEIVIPVYPELNDMVHICGSNNETWLGLVKSVDRVNKTCNVNFYIEDPSCEGRYKQEYFWTSCLLILYTGIPF